MAGLWSVTSLLARPRLAGQGGLSLFRLKADPQTCACHVNRYLAEFSFRYSHRTETGFDDMARFE
jgi:hypothetical protein